MLCVLLIIAELRISLFQEHGFATPILVKDSTELGMRYDVLIFEVPLVLTVPKKINLKNCKTLEGYLHNDSL